MFIFMRKVTVQATVIEESLPCSISANRYIIRPYYF